NLRVLSNFPAILLLPKSANVSGRCGAGNGILAAEHKESLWRTWRYRIPSMLHLDVCENKKIERDVPVSRLEELIGRAEVTFWLDMDHPGEDDWQLLEPRFHFHPLAIEDARLRNQRSKVDQYEGYLFLSVHTWAGSPSVTEDPSQIMEEI